MLCRCSVVFMLVVVDVGLLELCFNWLFTDCLLCLVVGLVCLRGLVLLVLIGDLFCSFIVIVGLQVWFADLFLDCCVVYGRLDLFLMLAGVVYL